jgi:hypothetical protein
LCQSQGKLQAAAEKSYKINDLLDFIRQQCHFTSTLDALRKLVLVLAASPGLTSLAYPAAVIEIIG